MLLVIKGESVGQQNRVASLVAVDVVGAKLWVIEQYVGVSR